jgi:hypothetical protein
MIHDINLKKKKKKEIEISFQWMAVDLYGFLREREREITDA